MAFTPPSAQFNVASLIRDTASIENLAVKLLVYGLAGVGKTRLIGTLPAPIIISAEGGSLSLRKSHLPIIDIDSLDKLKAVHQWLYYAQDGYQFRSVGVDSASEIAEVVLANEMKNNKDPRKAYGEMATQMMDILRAYRDLPYRHVAFTAKQGRITDQTTGGIMYGPLMPGQQLDQQMPYMFDEVFHLGSYRDPQGQEYGALRTRPDNQFQAKDRSGSLDTWEQPNLTAVIEKIMRG